MDLIVATNNKNKINEIRKIAGHYFDNIYSLSDKGIKIEIEETGMSFYENAYIKANAVFNITHMPTLADDSGLCVNALNGEPGVMSARYSGAHGDDKSNNKLLLKKMENIKNRKAYFQSVVVLKYDNETAFYGEGKCEGEIMHEEKGTNGFGYDPLFYSYDLKKSFGEATDEEKNSISHRARALQDLMIKVMK
jgi:XTP/dITP diphosphohydrolase